MPDLAKPISYYFWDAWGAALSYTFQLYYDFSGYATMAIGLGLLFNIKLPTNFNNPYRACNIQDFWRRWHITLSNWLKSYIYIPLGGNRKGLIMTLVNVFITAFVSGVWHGANWTFILWGALHGIAMITHRVWSLTNIKLPILVSWFLTFIFIVITWVIFRSENVTDATNIVCSMFGINRGFTPSKEWVDIINSTIGVYKEFSYGNNEFIYPNILLFMFFLLFFPILKRKSMQTITIEKEVTLLLPCTVFFVLSIVFQFGYDNVESTFLYFDF
ncbi:MBOAT family O-acyltransferase [Vibrio sp. SCSIO 43137]|uniref:MBOAT family O-acyltransferase n=1 Tax=Vibrio sp. SCSIO 43137 TaxID=3021011 RepID=UPI002FE38742